MITFGSSYRYYVHRAPTDMRKSFVINVNYFFGRRQFV